VFASDSKLDRCKLEGHILDITQVHQAVVPWHRHHAYSIGPVEYAVVRSSLPLEQRVLHDRTGPAADQFPSPAVPRFTAFARSVKARLLQDLKILPLRNPETDTLDRQNITVYTDEPAGQILLVYAPTKPPTTSGVGDPVFEFVSFSLPRD
jgi:hypothetical protein